YFNQNPGTGTNTIALGLNNSQTDPSSFPNYPLNVVNNSGQYGPTGLPVVTANITIVGNGATIGRTAGPSFRLFAVGPEGSLTVDNLTLQGGWADGRYNSALPPAAADGGAIYIDQGSTLTLSGVTVTGNAAFGA